MEFKAFNDDGIQSFRRRETNDCQRIGGGNKMRKKKKGRWRRDMFLCLMLMLLAGYALAAKAEEGPGDEAAPRLSNTSIVMVQGKSYRLKISGAEASAKIRWRSNNKKVATVSSIGKVTAKAAGKTRIVVKVGKKKLRCRVTVVKAALNLKKLSIEEGKTKKLKVSGVGSGVTWKSSNPQVVSVNRSGKIKAKKQGTATICAMVGVSKLKCRVTVEGDRWDQLLEQYRDDAKTNQLVFVRYTGGSSATVQMYTKSGNQWTRILDCNGYVGSNGIGKTKEGDRKTPTGTFNLTQAFGIKDDPGAGTPYVKVTQYLYWCGDQPYYNQLIDVREHPHQCRGEHLIDYVPHYYYGMFLDYNKDCVYGKGSAIFLHCTGPNPYTAGCIAVSQENMIKIIRNAKSGAKICIYPA